MELEWLDVGEERKGRDNNNLQRGIFKHRQCIGRELKYFYLYNNHHEPYMFAFIAKGQDIPVDQWAIWLSL